MTINPKLVQQIVSYIAILFGVLTTQLQSIHLPPTASLILGAFGILLHPQTSITVPTPPVATGAGTETYKTP